MLSRVALLVVGCAGLSAAQDAAPVTTTVSSCYAMENALSTTSMIGTKTACEASANKFCETYITFAANRIITAKKKCVATCVDDTNNVIGAGNQRICCNSAANCNDMTYKNGQKFSGSSSIGPARLWALAALAALPLLRLLH